MRQRKANEVAVEKTISFLEELKYLLDEKRKFNSSELQTYHGISKSTFSVCKKLDFIKGGKWLAVDPNRQQALSILEVLRQQHSKRIDVALSDDFALAIDRLITKLDNVSSENNNGLHGLKTPMLNRALQQQSMQGNTLFSDQESKQRDRVEMAKSIASGAFKNFEDLNNYSSINIRIITAADDLLNKLNSKP